MALAFVNVGATTAGTGSSDAGYPAGIAAHQLLVLGVVSKYVAPTTPSGWSLAWQSSGGSGASGVDSGSVFLSVYVKIAAGTESGSQTVTVPGGNSVIARMVNYSIGATSTWELSAFAGTDTTGDTTWSATASADPGLTASDLLMVWSALNADIALSSGHAVSASGVTFGTIQQRFASTTALGDDCALRLSDNSVSAGTSTGAPTYSATAASSTANAPCGVSAFVRIREMPAVSVSETVAVTEVLPAQVATAATAAESVALSDSATVSAATAVGIADEAALSDAAMVGYGANANPLDTIDVSVAADVVGHAFVTASEDVDVDDTLSAGMATATSVTETVDVLGAAAMSAGLVEGIVDVAGIDDDLAVRSDVVVPLADAVALVEAADSLAVQVLPIEDAVTWSDYASARPWRVGHRGGTRGAGHRGGVRILPGDGDAI